MTYQLLQILNLVILWSVKLYVEIRQLTDGFIQSLKIALSDSAISVTKMLMTLFILIFISACQTNSTGSQGGTSGSQTPSVPSSGGSSGSQSEDSSSSSPSSSSDGQSQSSESGETPPEGGESDGSESTAETSPDWEEETEGGDTEGGEGGDASSEDSEVTFEEQDETDGDVTFEEPAFEDNGGLTEQELEELERELNESLGDFDEEIQREKTYAEERANDNTDAGPLGGVGVFESYEEDQANNENSSSSGTSASTSESAQSAASDAESASSSSDSGEAATNAGTVVGDQKSQSEGVGEEVEDSDTTPVDIPDEIVSDDIVARQIREAAENETDPELKEKLWVEYRKYKNQQ